MIAKLLSHLRYLSSRPNQSQKISDLLHDGQQIVQLLLDGNLQTLTSRHDFREVVVHFLRHQQPFIRACAVEKKQFHHFNGIFRSFAIAILLMVSGFMFSVALAQSLQVIGNKTFFEECIKIYDSEEMNVNLYKHCVSEAAFCQNLFHYLYNFGN